MSYAVLDPPLPESRGSGNGTIESAIARTLPVNVGQRHRCLFEFARELKALPEYRDADLSNLRRPAPLAPIGPTDYPNEVVR